MSAITGTLMDGQELQQWILRKLGAPFSKVELSEDHLADALEDACRWFSAKKGFRKSTTMQLTPGLTNHPLPDDVDTVYEVAFPRQGMHGIERLVDPLALVDGIPGSLYRGGGLLSSYAQVNQFLSQARRVLGSEMEWLQQGRELYVFPAKGGTILLEYKANTFTVEQLQERDHDLVKRKALALAKVTLGRIRSKFDSFPGAQGSVQMDGSILLQEAREEEDRLDEEIMKSAYPIGFMRG